ncbi:MAG TPA: sterol-binding protein [Gammaproteobacteria bacterium]|nr:sterol-binding protein [Gammaproteobacteria bacterium]
MPAPARPLPALLAAPLALLPGGVHSRLLAAALNRVLATPLAEGELDFLAGRSLSIRVRDAGIAFRLGWRDGRLVAQPDGGRPDLSIEAALYDFLMLAGRREDPDTLVFQRRLVMQGDTELGLETKNFLDGLDVEALNLPAWCDKALQQAAPAYRRLFGPSPTRFTESRKPQWPTKGTTSR